MTRDNNRNVRALRGAGMALTLIALGCGDSDNKSDAGSEKQTKTSGYVGAGDAPEDILGGTAPNASAAGGRGGGAGASGSGALSGDDGGIDDDAGFDRFGDDEPAAVSLCVSGDTAGATDTEALLDVGFQNEDTTFPDIAHAVPGDDGVGPKPLGKVTELPDSEHLNFLFELCEPEGCFRDAHFMPSDDAVEGAGPWTIGRPFHIRHGFQNSGKALPDGFDVAVYITRWEGPASSVFEKGKTYRFVSDFVFRAKSDRCGPTYRTQTGPESCEWFVHDFPDGLPEGRFDLWAIWEAPRSAWLELGFEVGDGDPDEVLARFASGVNSPFEDDPPIFDEENQCQ